MVRIVVTTIEQFHLWTSKCRYFVNFGTCTKLQNKFMIRVTGFAVVYDEIVHK